MFASKLSRVAHRATAAPLAPALSTPQCLASTAQRRPHQRRHSSSKVSGPPESGSKPAPAAKAPAAERAADAPSAQKEKGVRRLSRTKRPERNWQKQKAAVAEVEEQSQAYAGLPSVPDVRHIGEKDIRMSSFFGLHRPLSLGTTIPPSATEDQFSRIFESRPQVDAWKDGNSAQRRPEDVTYALQQTIRVLHGAANAAEEEAVRWEVLQESASNNNRSVRHLDAPPRAARNIEELMNQFEPYNAPPPPQAFPEESEAIERKRPARRATQTRTNRSKSFTTTIVITEHPSASGSPTYTTSQSPLVRLPDPESASQRKPHQPFLQRAWRRQRAYLESRQQLPRLPKTFFNSNPLSIVRRAPLSGLRRPVQMRLISVKRQRKLKMKKHKYKKLMKRTRNLRRRLDRN